MKARALGGETVELALEEPTVLGQLLFSLSSEELLRFLSGSRRSAEETLLAARHR